MRNKGKATWMVGATAALSFVTFAASSANDVILITPVSVSASSFYGVASSPNSYHPPQFMIDGSGLTGTGRTAVHTCVYYSRTWWYSAGGIRVASQWVEFDLGAAYTISNALVWQMAASGGLRTRGVREFTIKVAGPEKVFSTLSTGNVLNQATCPDEEPVQVVPLAATNVRYVRFEIQSNWGAPNIVGLSEVRFEGFLAR